MLQIFDTNADALCPNQFNEFILPYLALLPTLVRAALAPHNLPCPPMTVFAKGRNTRSELFSLANCGYETVGLDWGISPRDARVFTEGKVALQGNFDPPILHAGRKAIEEQVKEMVWGKDGYYTIAKEGMTGGWICNLGHGITPGVDPEDLRFFLTRVRIECAKSSAEAPDAPLV